MMSFRLPFLLSQSEITTDRPSRSALDCSKLAPVSLKMEKYCLIGSLFSTAREARKPKLYLPGYFFCSDTFGSQSITAFSLGYSFQAGGKRISRSTALIPFSMMVRELEPLPATFPELFM